MQKPQITDPTDADRTRQIDELAIRLGAKAGGADGESVEQPLETCADLATVLEDLARELRKRGPRALNAAAWTLAGLCVDFRAIVVTAAPLTRKPKGKPVKTKAVVATLRTEAPAANDDLRHAVKSPKHTPSPGGAAIGTGKVRGASAGAEEGQPERQQRLVDKFRQNLKRDHGIMFLPPKAGRTEASGDELYRVTSGGLSTPPRVTGGKGSPRK